MKKVSVIIPVRDRKDYLTLSLASYRTQTYPMNQFEIVIVNDGSTENFLSDIEEQDWPFPLKIVRNPKPLGAGAARDKGVKASTGEILLFTDSDMIVPNDFIEKHARHHERGDHYIVSSPYRDRIYTKLYPNNLKNNLFKRMLKIHPAIQDKIPQHFGSKSDPIILFSTKDVLNGTVQNITKKMNGNEKGKSFLKEYGTNLKNCPIPWMAFNSYSASISRKTYDLVGGFYNDIRYRHTDRAFGYRLHKLGYSFLSDPEIIPIHQQHPPHKDMNKWIRNEYKKWLKKHPDRAIYLFGLRMVDFHFRDKLFFSKLTAELDLLEHKNKKFSKRIDQWIKAWIHYYLNHKKKNSLLRAHKRIRKSVLALRSKNQNYKSIEKAYKYLNRRKELSFY